MKKIVLFLIFIGLSGILFGANECINQTEFVCRLYKSYSSGTQYVHSYITNSAQTENDLLLIGCWLYASETISAISVNGTAPSLVTKYTGTEAGYQNFYLYSYPNPVSFKANYVAITLSAAGYAGFIYSIYSSVSPTITNIQTFAQNNTGTAGVTLTASDNYNKMILYACSRGDSSAVPLGGNTKILTRYDYPTTSDRDFYYGEITSTASGIQYYLGVTATTQPGNGIVLVGVELQRADPNAPATRPVYNNYTWTIPTLIYGTGEVIAAYNFENNGVDLTGHGYDLYVVGNPFTNDKAYDGNYSIKPDSNNYLMFPPSLNSYLYGIITTTADTNNVIHISFYTYIPQQANNAVLIPTLSGNCMGLGFFWNGTDHRTCLGITNNWNYCMNYTENYGDSWMYVGYQWKPSTWKNNYWVGTLNENIGDQLGVANNNDNPLKNVLDVWMLNNAGSDVAYIDRMIVYKGFTNKLAASWEEVQSTPTPTNTNTFTATFTNTFTNTFTETYTITNTFTETYTNTFTETYTNTFTLTQTNTHTYTNTFTETFTHTHTDTFTETFTEIFTPTETATLYLTIEKSTEKNNYNLGDFITYINIFSFYNSVTFTAWDTLPDGLTLYYLEPEKVTGIVKSNNSVAPFKPTDYGCYYNGKFYAPSYGGLCVFVYDNDLNHIDTINFYDPAPPFFNPLICDTDGNYLWVGGYYREYEGATVYPIIGKINLSNYLDKKFFIFTSWGAGGVEGLVCYKNKVIIGIQQFPYGRIIVFDPYIEQVELNVSGQNNVNGVICDEIDGVDYAFGFCNNFVSKINLNTGEWTYVITTYTTYRGDIDKQNKKIFTVSYWYYNIYKIDARSMEIDEVINPEVNLWNDLIYKYGYIFLVNDYNNIYVYKTYPNIVLDNIFYDAGKSSIRMRDDTGEFFTITREVGVSKITSNLGYNQQNNVVKTNYLFSVIEKTLIFKIICKITEYIRYINNTICGKLENTDEVICASKNIILNTPTITKTITPTITKTITPTLTITPTPEKISGYYYSTQNLIKTNLWGSVIINNEEGSANIYHNWNTTNYCVNYSFVNRIPYAIWCKVEKYSNYFTLIVKDKNNNTINCSGKNLEINFDVYKY